MSLFKTKRERRLWTLALIAAVAIFSGLFLSETLSELFQIGGVLAALFAAGALSVLIASALLGLKARPRGIEIGVILGIAAVYLLLFVRVLTPVERSHVIEYGVLAAFVHEALVERAGGNRLFLPAVFALLITTLVGALDEFSQLFIPSRVFDPVDIFFNFFAAAIMIAVKVILALVSGRGWRSDKK